MSQVKRVISEFISRVKPDKTNIDRMTKDQMIEYIENSSLLKIYIKSVGETVGEKKIKSLLVSKSLGKDELPLTLSTLKRMQPQKLKAFLKTVYKRLGLPKDFSKMRVKTLESYVKKHKLAESMGMGMSKESKTVSQQGKNPPSAPKAPKPAPLVPVIKSRGGPRYFGKTTQQRIAESAAAMTSERQTLELQLFRKKVSEDVANMVATQKERFQNLTAKLSSELAGTEAAILQSQVSKERSKAELDQLKEVRQLKESLQEQRKDFNESMEKLRLSMEKEQKEDERAEQKVQIKTQAARRELEIKDIPAKVRAEFEEMITRRLQTRYENQTRTLAAEVKAEVQKEMKDVYRDSAKSDALAKGFESRLKAMETAHDLANKATAQRIKEKEDRITELSKERVTWLEKVKTVEQLKTDIDKSTKARASAELELRNRIVKMRKDFASSLVEIQAQQIKSKEAQMNFRKTAQVHESEMLGAEFEEDLTAGMRKYIQSTRKEFEHAMEIDDGVGPSSYVDDKGKTHEVSSESMRKQIVSIRAKTALQSEKLKLVTLERQVKEQEDMVKAADLSLVNKGRLDQIEQDFRKALSELESEAERGVADEKMDVSPVEMISKSGQTDPRSPPKLTIARGARTDIPPVHAKTPESKPSSMAVDSPAKLEFGAAEPFSQGERFTPAVELSFAGPPPLESDEKDSPSPEPDIKPEPAGIKREPGIKHEPGIK